MDDNTTKQKVHRTSYLQKHSAEKVFQCKLCQLSFARSNDYKRHVRIHTGERPFKCKFCQHSFTRSNDCKRQERIHPSL